MRGNIPDAVDHALRSPRSLAPLVLVMGFLGATARYALEMLLPAQCGFPVATLAVNIFGCFTLEIVNQFVARRTSLPAPLVKSMGIGLIGAFTTIAALSTENLAFLQSRRYGMFAAYLGITVATTFGAALAGKAVADKLAKRHERGGAPGRHACCETEIGADSRYLSGDRKQDAVGVNAPEASATKRDGGRTRSGGPEHGRGESVGDAR